MKPYPAYKFSGVPWLGEMPAHWESKAAKFLVTCNDDVLTEDVDPATEIVYVEIADVEEGQGIKATTDMFFKDAPSRARRQVKHGDIIVSTVRTYLKAIAPVENPPENLVVSTGFAVLRPHGVAQGFAKYAFAESGFINTVIARSNGVSYPAINATDLVRIPIPVPPVVEQQSIAAYLDRETARIDMLLAEKRRLIETLREYRQATISEVVTQGLNPAAPKKPSGVPWLGEIPVHWNVQRLRFRCKLNPSVKDGLSDDDVASFLPMEAVGDDGSLNLEATRLVGDVASGYTYFEDGDVTIAKITPCFENGKGAVMRGLQGGIGFGTTELIVIRPNDTVHPDWLYCLTQSDAFRKRGEAMMYGAGGQKRVPDLYVRDLPIAWPPIEEQQSIADYLASETARIDKLIDHVQDEIKLLQELRAATITDAVTGKIKVS